MPATKKGKKIKRKFTKRYGARGERVFYATAAKRGKGLYRAAHGRSKTARKRKKRRSRR